WRGLAAEIRADICANGYDSARNTFVQYYGGAALDASLLLIPQVGFLPADDPRVVGTVQAIERELLRDGLLLRYSTEQSDDGLPGDEGVFLACSFWLADAYIMQGRLDDANRLFDHLLSLRNDLGLLAEEYDVVRRRLVGNFPQGFSHIGLVNTAYNLSAAGGPARQRSSREAPHDCRRRRALLLRLDAGGGDDLAPLAAFRFGEPGEGLGVGAHRLGAQAGVLAHQVGLPQGARRVFGQLGDDVGRRAGRSPQAVPGADGEAGVAGFGHGGHVGQFIDPLRGRRAGGRRA